MSVHYYCDFCGDKVDPATEYRPGSREIKRYYGAGVYPRLKVLVSIRPDPECGAAHRHICSRCVTRVVRSCFPNGDEG